MGRKMGPKGKALRALKRKHQQLLSGGLEIVTPYKPVRTVGWPKGTEFSPGCYRVQAIS